MNWLTRWRRLRAAGILGMNHRNAECILDLNPRRVFPLVDTKSKMHRLCQELFPVIDAEPGRGREELRIGQCGTVVEHRDFEIQLKGEGRDSLGHVTRTGDPQRARRRNGFLIEPFIGVVWLEFTL